MRKAINILLKKKLEAPNSEKAKGAGLLFKV